jgi:hypothetical protein
MVRALLLIPQRYCLFEPTTSMPTRTAVRKTPRERLLFNDGWRFFRGDAPDAAAALDYARLRPWLLATGAELVNEGVPRPLRQRTR